MKNTFSIVAAFPFVLSAPMALAGTGDVTLYSEAPWQVERHVDDDGNMDCEATTDSDDDDHVGDGSLLTIIEEKTGSYEFSFYDMSWGFGKYQSGTLKLQVDGNDGFSVQNAQFEDSVALFDVPNGSDGEKFISQINSGEHLYFYDSAGKLMESYNLSGSPAAMSALANCVAGLP